MDDLTARNKKSLSSRFFKFLRRVLGTIILPLILILGNIWLVETDDFFWAGFFYIPYDIYIAFYYWRLIWKKNVTGRDILMLPILKKIGIRNDGNNFKDRMILLCTIVPALFCSIVCPLCASIFASFSYIQRYSFTYEDNPNLAKFSLFLIMPIIIWGVALVINYSYDWLKNINPEKDN